MEHLHALILSGGGGTRLWPLSRRARPKQLLRLVGDETLLSACAERIVPLCSWRRLVVVTTEAQATAVRADLPELPPKNVIAEPIGRNTAPAIGLGARAILARDPDAVIAVLPADHYVGDVDAFQRAVLLAEEMAAQGHLVTIGIRPDRPDTGFGYIEMGVETQPGVRGAVRFTEKPDASTARAFLAGKRHVWNSGMFFFRADRILEELAKHLPDVYAVLGSADGVVDPVAYATAPAISIDYGVMEKVDEFYVVPGDFGWSDIGSFAALPESTGDVISIDASDNVVSAEGKTVALIGVRDLCVAVTDDVVLICPKARAQDVRKVVAELEQSGRKELL